MPVFCVLTDLIVLSRAAGIGHFSYISSAGANKNSWFLYMKTKGEVEEALAAQQFPHLSIFRCFEDSPIALSLIVVPDELTPCCLGPCA